MKKVLYTTLSLIAITLLTTSVQAQRWGRGDNGRGNAYGHYKHDEYRRGGYGYGQMRGYGRPTWGYAHNYDFRRHVYFPRYRTFYDPYRSGYVYWRNNAWAFSPNVPAFLANVDLGAAQMQYMDGLPISTPPENYYGYVQRYPSALSININIGGRRY